MKLSFLISLILFTSSLYGMVIEIEKKEKNDKEIFLEKIQQLILEGQDINLTYELLDENPSEEMPELIREGSVYGPSYTKDTPLIKATSKQNIEAVKLLILNKATVNVKNRDKRTALHYAAVVGSLEIIKLLLDAKSDINEKTSNSPEITCIHLAISHDRSNLFNTIEFLIKHGANLDITDRFKNTPLMNLTKKIETFDMSANLREDLISKNARYLNIIKLMIYNNANINLRNKRNQTFLQTLNDPSYTENIKQICLEYDNYKLSTAQEISRVTPLIPDLAKIVSGFLF